MSKNDHERAREIIAGAGANDAVSQQQTWPREHLQGCPACRDYADAADQVFRALQSDALTLDYGLVEATRMRMHLRAFELRQQRERFWLVCLSCSLVGVSAVITTPLFWRVFQWVGLLVGLSSSVWQAGFAFLWIAPALVVGAALLARGTHLTNNNTVEMQWK